jgi:hypothetical protein
MVEWWSRLPYTVRICTAGVLGSLALLVFLFWDRPMFNRLERQWRAVAAARYTGWAEPAALERRLAREHDACRPAYDPLLKYRRDVPGLEGSLPRYLACMDGKVLQGRSAPAAELEAGCAGARPWDCYRLAQRLGEGTDEEAGRATVLLRRACRAGLAPACDRTETRLVFAD